MDDLDQIKRLMDPPTRLTAEATQTARGRLLAVATEPSMHRRWRRRGLGLGSPRRRLGVLAISGA
ncbi:MAG: hypothetical protein JWN52_5858, partial [Actinomycetia bacterium]|nr:hypothetical protein [Actinomycetes bacterium]